MVIGIDFDNTVVCYDEVFYQAALEKNLIPAGIQHNKNSVRDYLREIDKENNWTELQGLVYGVYIKYAPAFSGMLDFLRLSKKQGIKIYIISHKTRYPFMGQIYDLHQAAYNWLKIRSFYDDASIGISSDRVYFAPTKEEKINRINEVGCTHFIDDLPEFLEYPDFPNDVERILFDPADIYRNNNCFLRFNSWDEIRKYVFFRS